MEVTGEAREGDVPATLSPPAPQAVSKVGLGGCFEASGVDEAAGGVVGEVADPTPPEPPTVVCAADRSGQDLGGRHDLVRVGRGAYMVRTPPGTPAWRVKELVTLARCEAVLRAVLSALSLLHDAAPLSRGWRLSRSNRILE